MEFPSLPGNRHGKDILLKINDEQIEANCKAKKSVPQESAVFSILSPDALLVGFFCFPMRSPQWIIVLAMEPIAASDGRVMALPARDNALRIILDTLSSVMY